MTENLAARGEGLAGLGEWLREQSEELMKSAIAREGTAEIMRAATLKELRSARVLAEKMSGRKLPSKSCEETKIEADIQCSIAAKLDKKARQISVWADELAALDAAPAGTAPEERAWLIERPGPEWLEAWSGGYDWTKDSLKAIRFCRRSDANQIAEIFDGEDVHITEHIWN